MRSMTANLRPMNCATILILESLVLSSTWHKSTAYKRSTAQVIMGQPRNAL